MRSIRVIDDIWRGFGEMVDQLVITRADLLEEMVKSNSISFNSI